MVDSDPVFFGKDPSAMNLPGPSRRIRVEPLPVSEPPEITEHPQMPEAPDRTAAPQVREPVPSQLAFVVARQRH
jgi:hypothetical protein